MTLSWTFWLHHQQYYNNSWTIMNGTVIVAVSWYLCPKTCYHKVFSTWDSWVALLILLGHQDLKLYNLSDWTYAHFPDKFSHSTLDWLMINAFMKMKMTVLIISCPKIHYFIIYKLNAPWFIPIRLELFNFCILTEVLDTWRECRIPFRVFKEHMVRKFTFICIEEICIDSFVYVPLSGTSTFMTF